MTNEELLNKLGSICTDIQAVFSLAEQDLLKSERKHQVLLETKQRFAEVKPFLGEIEQLKIDKTVSPWTMMYRVETFVSLDEAKSSLEPLLKLAEEIISVIGGQTPQKDIFLREDAPYEGRKILRSVFNQAKSKLLIVDGYLRPELLEVLQLNLEDVSGLELNFLTQKNNNKFFTTFSSDLNKLAQQYPNNTILLKYYNNLPPHDRYIIVDDDLVFHSGHSLAELGNRASSINRIEGDARDSAKVHITDFWKNGQI